MQNLLTADAPPHLAGIAVDDRMSHADTAPRPDRKPHTGRPNDVVLPAQGLAGRLRHAEFLARHGDPQSAREICADIIFADLPRIATENPLLTRAIVALLHARGFSLLTRLLVAVHGRRIRFVIAPPAAASPIDPPGIVVSSPGGGDTVTLDEGMFTSPSGAVAIERWAAHLATRATPTARPSGG